HYEPYLPQAGDTTRADGSAVILKRGGKEIGYLIGVRKDGFVAFETFSGDPLLDDAAENAATYTVQSAADPGFVQGVQPAVVWRKSKPTDWAQPTRQFVWSHIVYLKLPRPLTSGKTYTIRFADALNVQQPSVPFPCADSLTHSEAVHVNQIGFRSDDPLKHGFLSVWLGTGGGYEYPALPKFSVVNLKTGRAVLSGVCQRIKGKDEADTMWQGKRDNYPATAVYRFDFSSLVAPGRYRIAVAGVGCSYPFAIGEDTWRKAFLIQMRGLFNNRSGMALGPPYTTFKKPRDFHPGDREVKITQSTYSSIGPIVKGQQGFPKNLADGDTGRLVPGAWGGYHDAGDWNPRRVTHMRVTLAQLEVFELFPTYFAPLKLRIPPRTGLPDVLTEALFELDCFRRLQQADGGVPHEIETDGDPIAEELSWKQSMPAFVSAPDVRGGWYYALVAAKFAKLVTPYDRTLAKTYRESAIRAFEWAERDRNKRRAAGNLLSIPWEVRDMRNLAALYLYDLVGTARYHDVFLQDTVLRDENPNLHQWGKAVQRDAAFAYAVLPPTRNPNPALVRHARQGLIQQAESALAYAAGNSYRVTTPDPGRPMFLGFWSTPDAIEVCRAHYLTGEKKYLAGAIQACIFAGGGNPNNITYTSGLGANPVKHPFHIDSRATGQPAPEGLSVYGNYDWRNWSTQEWALWPMKHYLGQQCRPNAYDWPVTEGYFDIYRFIAQNEFTVDAWAPNVYVWGYLAARGPNVARR
ncbi:MAG: glycoside hydrolase family 9 protein, partial [Cytophagales bacterium]|nr:glycoside hydrolase family 9 protein [Armatimonadota bacterium]